MKNNFTLFVSLLISLGSVAQELISTDGGVYQNSDIQLSYSIGEVVTETLSGSTMLTQGFQQVDEIFTGVDDKSAEIGFRLYPNPCTSELFLSGNATGDIRVEVYDLRGKLLLQQQFRYENISVLNVSDLSNGAYLIRIQSETDFEPQTIHFQKIN